MTTTGAKPQGAKDEASAAKAVRRMFDAIAPRYDLLNHVLSRMWTGCGGVKWRGAFAQFWPIPTRRCSTSAAARAT